MGKDILLLNPFLCQKAAQREKLSLIDISLQRLDFINLQHVVRPTKNVYTLK